MLQGWEDCFKGEAPLEKHRGPRTVFGVEKPKGGVKMGGDLEKLFPASRDCLASILSITSKVDTAGERLEWRGATDCGRWV